MNARRPKLTDGALVWADAPIDALVHATDTPEQNEQGIYYCIVPAHTQDIQKSDIKAEVAGFLDNESTLRKIIEGLKDGKDVLEKTNDLNNDFVKRVKTHPKVTELARDIRDITQKAYRQLKYANKALEQFSKSSTDEIAKLANEAQGAAKSALEGIEKEFKQNAISALNLGVKHKLLKNSDVVTMKKYWIVSTRSMKRFKRYMDLGDFVEDITDTMKALGDDTAKSISALKESYFGQVAKGAFKALKKALSIDNVLIGYDFQKAVRANSKDAKTKAYDDFIGTAGEAAVSGIVLILAGLVGAKAGVILGITIGLIVVLEALDNYIDEAIERSDAGEYLTDLESKIENIYNDTSNKINAFELNELETKIKELLQKLEQDSKDKLDGKKLKEKLRMLIEKAERKMPVLA